MFREFEDFWQDDTRGMSDFIREFNKRAEKPLTGTEFRRTIEIANALRAVSGRSPFWPSGVSKGRNQVKQLFRLIGDNVDIVGCNFFELGSGDKQPFTTAAMMFANGAADAIAFDISDIARPEAAIALYDVICDAVINPDLWHFSALDRAEFLRRLRRFDMEALRMGSLRRGIADAPIRFVQGDISMIAGHSSYATVMTSWMVLEHVMRFEDAVRNIHRILRPGGACFHAFDLGDHRKRRRQHAFSFLAEPDYAGLENRLRSCQVRAFFEAAGLEAIFYDEKSDSMPSGFEEQLLPEFRRFSKEEIEVTRVDCGFRRPRG